MRLLADTNILLRLRDADSASHHACALALDRLRQHGDDVCVCAQVLIEYWAVATRPRGVNGLGITPTGADEDLGDFLDLFECLPEPPDVLPRWRGLVSGTACRGRQVHDARLVAVMLAHGITHILTLNPDDFARYPEITPVMPAQA